MDLSKCKLGAFVLSLVLNNPNDPPENNLKIGAAWNPETDELKHPSLKHCSLLQ